MQVKGIKLLGDKAIAALAKEYEQLDDLEVFKPRYAPSLTRDK